jgi:hypothetical protein
MRPVMLSTDVFARVWSLRRAGEDTEDMILRRVLECPPAPNSEAVPVPPPQPNGGLLDGRSGVLFVEGFEVFRGYLGTEYRARVVRGKWVLQNDSHTFGSLNELSRAIGAKTENAWLNWFFIDHAGKRRPASDLRDPNTIPSRSRSQESIMDALNPVRSQTAELKLSEINSDATWRDDVRASLERLSGRAFLSGIYREVKAIRQTAGRSVPPSLEATIRRTLEDHSSDSENYRGGPDLFYMPEGKGAGVWALR